MLGRAVAVGHVLGAAAGLRETDRLRDVIGERHRWHAVRGHLHELDGDLPAAATAYAEAARRATNVAERDHLVRQAARARAGCVLIEQLTIRRMRAHGEVPPQRRLRQVPAGWKSSIGFPDGSSIRICWPPGPLTMSLRNVRPAARRRSTSAAMSSTIRWMRFQPPGFGLAAVGHRSPGGAGGAAEQQPQPAADDVGERGRRAREHREPEVLGVEVDGGARRRRRCSGR